MTQKTKEYANEYYEETEDISLHAVTGTTFGRPLDITYTTHNGTKTIRSVSAHSSLNFSDDLYVFYDEEKKYGFDIDSKKLYSVDQSRDTPLRTIADQTDIVAITRVKFPTRAPVVGAIQTDVQATIYYRSPRSNKMQSIEIKVSHNENDVKFEGKCTESGDWVEALCIHEREISKKHPKQHLGRVTRVEFPRGHRFTIDVEGISDERVTNIKEAIESSIKDEYYLPVDASVSVKHDSEMDWD